MTESKLAAIVERHPSVIKAYTGFTNAGAQPLLKPTERLEAIKLLIPAVCSRINHECDWDFNTSEVDMRTVANQGVYSCEGNNDDSRDIITVLYGAEESSLKPLDEFNPVKGDDLQYNAGITSVVFWRHSTRKADYPHFELVGAPDNSGYLIRLRYRMKTIGVAEFPEGFDLMLQWGLMAEISPREHEGKYREMRNLLVARHQGSGREYSRVRGDPDVEARNVQFSTLRGPY